MAFHEGREETTQVTVNDEFDEGLWERESSWERNKPAVIRFVVFSILVVCFCTASGKGSILVLDTAGESTGLMAFFQDHMLSVLTPQRQLYQAHNRPPVTLQPQPHEVHNPPPVDLPPQPQEAYNPSPVTLPAQPQEADNPPPVALLPQPQEDLNPPPVTLPPEPYEAPGKRPQAFEGCGNWQEDYIALHNSILSGRSPPRYVVSVAVASGLADRITGIVTEFYFALLTGRAFQISHGTQAAFERAYDAPFVNWTRPAELPELLGPLTRERWQDNWNSSSWGEELGQKKYGFVYRQMEDINYAGNDFFTKDLRTIPGGYGTEEVIFISSNRGRTFGMFQNPFHGDQLRQWGLQPETAFACAFNFLFRPNAKTLATVKDSVQKLRENKDALKIGIKIRLGDYVFNGGDTFDISYAYPYLNCSQEVEETRRKPNQRVVWYLMTESLSLRKSIKKKYPDKVIANTEKKAIHVDCIAFGGESCGDPEDAPTEGMRFAAGQLYAFSLTDIQISTYASGFGRVGAWMSAANSGWTHPLVFYEIGGPQSCGLDDATSPERSSTSWSGI